MLVHGVEGRLNYLIKLNESPKFSEDLLSKANGIGYACVITGKGYRQILLQTVDSTTDRLWPGWGFQMLNPLIKPFGSPEFCV